jgi:S1-C subfamily serine protease
MTDQPGHSGPGSRDEGSSDQEGPESDSHSAVAVDHGPAGGGASPAPRSQPASSPWWRPGLSGRPHRRARSAAETSDLGRFDWYLDADQPGRRTRRFHARRPLRLVATREKWLHGWRLLAVALALAVTCTAVGGVIGGFVGAQTGGGQTDPTYSLGSVPPVLSDRPASSVAGIAARDMPAVVMIKVNGGEGTGSGFVIRGGYIITDNHVVTLDGLVSNASLRVYFDNGSSAPAQVVGRDPYSDIAVIKADGVTNLPALTLGNSASVQVGDPVLAIGSPLGLSDTVTSGIVSALNRPVQPGPANGSAPQVFFDAIQTDAPINPGNSGGPLVNARGQVIGVDAAIDTLGNDPITGTQGGSIGLGFAIPINQARRVILQLVRTGQATHSVIGAQLNDNFSGNGAQIETSAQGGGQPVVPGGPAAQAGLQPGDVIVRFAGLPVTGAYSLLDAMRSLAPGTTVGVTFVRQGQTMQTRLTLGSAQS